MRTPGGPFHTRRVLRREGPTAACSSTMPYYEFVRPADPLRIVWFLPRSHSHATVCMAKLHEPIARTR